MNRMKTLILSFLTLGIAVSTIRVNGGQIDYETLIAYLTNPNVSANTGGAIRPNATAGITQLIMGTSAAPEVLETNPGALIKARETSIKHSAGAGNCDDLLVDYKKLYVDGAGDAGMTTVVDATRLYIGQTSGNPVLAEAYMRQDILLKSGTGTVDTLCGNSIVVNLGSNNFTATSRVQGINVTMDGSAVVAGGDVDGIVLDIKSGRVVRKGVAVNCQTTTVSGIGITGSPIAEISLSNDRKVFTGAAATRAAVQALTGPSTAAIGSLFVGDAIVATTKPNLYVKMTATTWERVVTQAAD